MPYSSDAQRSYFNANREKIGGATVDEFNRSSKGKKLPRRKGKRHKRKAKRG
jgi:hypothetical protein